MSDEDSSRRAGDPAETAPPPETFESPDPLEELPSGPARRRRPAIARPLAIRDFALLWTAMTVSLIGDGIYFVALAWQVYELSNTPTALSVVGVAWTIPHVAFLLLGGVLADRFDRRRLMVAADAIRGVAIAAVGVLSVTGTLRLSHMLVLVAVYGVGDALFGPAFGSIIPEVVPRRLLVEANALNQLSRPLAIRLIGPAVGGVVIAGVGVGTAFLLDAVTFAVSAGAVVLMRPRPRAPTGDRSLRAGLREIAEGFRFVRSQPWLWATLLGAAVSLLAFYGPFQVLVPFVVKNELRAGADGLGVVFASEGVGAVLASLVVGQRGLPRRHITVMYTTWAAGALVIAGYAFVGRLWEAMLYGFIHGVLFAIGAIVWMTMMHRLVPANLLGRVTSFDWLISIGLLPASYGLTGPLAEAFGIDAVLIGAGVLSSMGILAFLFVPGVRDAERREAAPASARDEDGAVAQP